MERYGYITSEVLVQKGFGKGAISVVGARGERVEMYLMEYLGEIMRKSHKGNNKISYREEEKMNRNAELKRRRVMKSPFGMRRMMRQKR